MSARYVLVHDAIANRAVTEPVEGAGGPAVVVPGLGARGPAQLSGALVDVLIDAERAGAATVLLAAELGDLTTPVAAVCRYVAADHPDVVEEAGRQFGAERVLSVESVRVDQVETWIRELPETGPESVGLRRRFGVVADRLRSTRSKYGKMRGRST